MKVSGRGSSQNFGRGVLGGFDRRANSTDKAKKIRRISDFGFVGNLSLLLVLVSWVVAPELTALPRYSG